VICMRSAACVFRLRKLLLAGVLFLGPGFCAAQMQRFPPSAERFTVTGTVVNSETREPIRGALVEFQGTATLSDDRGNFVLREVPGGRVAVQAEKPGYLNRQEISNMPSPQEYVPVVRGMAPITVELVPEGVISGQVFSAGGEPLENIPVELLSAVIQDGLKNWQQRNGASTDDEGKFRIAELPPGTYYLHAGPSRNVAPTPGTAGAIKVQGYSMAYYPAGQALEDATPIVITPGKHFEAGISLVRQPFYRITGTLNGVSAIDAVSIQVLAPDGNSMGGAGMNPAKGAFRTNFLPAGNYVLRATAREQGRNGNMDDGSTRTGHAEVALNSENVEVHLNLAQARTIPVNFRMDSPPPAEVLTEGQPFIPVWPQLVPAGDGPRRPMGQGFSMTGPQGKQSVVLRNILPGHYRVEFGRSGRYYVAAATAGQTDLLRDDLVIGAEGSSEAIEIYVRDDAGALEASVESNGNKFGAAVFAVSEEFPNLVEFSPAGEDGTARFDGVPPGKYKVFALDSAEGIEYRKPGVLDAYLLRARDVNVSAKQQATVSVAILSREN
jgi:hypothetical protein